MNSDCAHDPSSFAEPVHEVQTTKRAERSVFPWSIVILRAALQQQLIMPENIDAGDSTRFIETTHDLHGANLVLPKSGNIVLESNENQTVPSLANLESDVNVVRKSQQVQRYIRAYDLAGKLGLENIQNWMVDRLITYHLDNLVLARDVNILLYAGVGKSNFASLLMRELARGTIDGRYCQTSQFADLGLEKVTISRLVNEEQDTDSEDNQTIDSGIVAGATPDGTDIFHGTNEISISTVHLPLD